LCGPLESPHASVRETSRSGSSRERLGREVARRTFTRARGRVAAAGARGLLNVIRTLPASVIGIKNNPSVVSRRSQTRSRCHRRKALLRVKLARARSLRRRTRTVGTKCATCFCENRRTQYPFLSYPCCVVLVGVCVEQRGGCVNAPANSYAPQRALERPGRSPQG